MRALVLKYILRNFLLWTPIWRILLLILSILFLNKFTFRFYWLLLLLLLLLLYIFNFLITCILQTLFILNILINISKRWLDCFCLLYWLIIFLSIVTHWMWTNAISFFHIEKSWTLAITFFFYASSNFFFLKNSILYTLISLIILWIFLKRFFGLRLSVNALIVLI